jgi:hypothetical protein
MAETARVGEQQSTEVLHDRVRAWWTSVLAGQLDQAHPIHGTKVSAKLEGDALIVSGSVPSDEDRKEIEREVEHLRGNGFKRLRNELEVEPEVEAEPGLLVQTLLSVFENEEQAGFAEGYLEGHAHVQPEAMKVIAPEGDGSAREEVRAMLPESYWEDADRALEAGRSLLVVTVDEPQAFKARELLDEETRSLETIALPPEPARNAGAIRRRLEGVVESPDALRSDSRADSAREESLREEGAIHEH